MIALLSYGVYYISGYEDIKDSLVGYVKYIDSMDTRVFEILAESNKMTIKELIEYINRHCCPDEKIEAIYELGKKIY